MIFIDQPTIDLVSKGWGFEKIIVNSEKYCGKLLYMVKDKKCSLHYHRMKDETFYVHSGKIIVYYSDNLVGINNTIKQVDPEMLSAILYNNDNIKWPGPSSKPEGLKRLVLRKGDNFYVPAMRIHQMLALEDAELYEFSTQHFDNDSLRIIKGD